MIADAGTVADQPGPAVNIPVITGDQAAVIDNGISQRRGTDAQYQLNAVRGGKGWLGKILGLEKNRAPEVPTRC